MKRGKVIERITRTHIERAIRQINEQKSVPERRNSRKYSLHHKGRDYPPKYLIMLAGKYATGMTLTPDNHSGGKQDSNRVLLNLGFKEQDIVDRPSRWPER
jgi:hypothetical protein